MEKSAEIYGIRAVIEAINSKKDIDKVFIPVSYTHLRAHET